MALSTMADPQVINTLTAKREEIESYIAKLDKQLQAARHDLAHVNATIRLFEITGERTEFPVYIQLTKMFPKGELPRLCREALEASPDGQLDTRQLATAVMVAKGWDATDRVMRSSVASRVTHLLKDQARRGKFRKAGRRAG